MPALDALHLKMTLHEDLHGSLLIGYLNTFVDTVEGKDIGPVPSGKTAVPSPGTFEKGVTGLDVAVRWAYWLDVGYTFYVAPTMQTLVTAAAESMPQEEVAPGDLPASQGFLWIPGGIGSLDVNGKLLKHNAVLWSVYGGRVSVVWLVDKNDPEDSGNIELRQTYPEKVMLDMPRLTPNHVSQMTFGQPLPQHLGPSQLKPEGVDVKVVRTQIPGGVEFKFMSRGEGAEEYAATADIGSRTDPAMRWLLACWRLMQQTVTSVIEEPAPRALRRQLQRQKLNDRAVSVIQLRQRTVAEHRGEGEAREWDHQWLVRGHWRNQPCKDADGAWTSRLVWIHPYVKGPEDKPLLVRDHVYSLVR